MKSVMTPLILVAVQISENRFSSFLKEGLAGLLALVVLIQSGGVIKGGIECCHGFADILRAQSVIGFFHVFEKSIAAGVEEVTFIILQIGDE